MTFRANAIVSWTRGGSWVLAAAVGLFALWAAAFAGVARAVSCETGSATITTVGETCYTVPAAVTSVQVLATGAAGGLGDGCSGAGAFGAQVAGDVSVTPGETLYAEVGSQGGSGASSGGAGGINGGGAGGVSGAGAGGGGGGGSDLRLRPASVSVGSVDSRLLVAGGGGGSGAANISCGGAGGTGGLSPSAGGNTSFANGGQPGGSVGGGAFGTSNGSCSSITNAKNGALGTGGAGAASPQVNCGGGGGGGGGFFGGGGGGTDGTVGGSGGGAGSSYASAVVNDSLITTATQAAGEVTITPLLATLSLSPTSGLTFAGTQPMQTLSSPLSLTIRNTGTGPLQISSLTFAGTDPQDFLISSDGCIGQVAAGAGCTVGVSFAPQGQGARSASLQIAGNAQNSPATVPLSGTGGSLPQGLRGTTGPPGAAGKVELITCKPVTKKIKGHPKTVQHCTGKVVSGTVKFTTTLATEEAAISRDRVVYARGTSTATGGGGRQLVLDYIRPMRPGRYTLTLRHRERERWRTQRETITLG